MFVGSTVGPSVLVKAGRVEVPLGEGEEAGTDVVGAGVSGAEAQSAVGGGAVGGGDLGMDLYDDEDEGLFSTFSSLISCYLSFSMLMLLDSSRFIWGVD